MDPYLEKRWGDVHTSLCAEIRTALQPNLPPGLRARAQEDVLLEEQNDKPPHRFEGDAVILEVSQEHHFSPASAAVATIEPLTLKRMPALHRDRWVEIIDTTAGNRVITVVEILSPGNKLSTNLNKRYLQKLDRYQYGCVNIVEIDLLRSNRSRLIIATEDIDPEKRAAYYTCINRQVDPDIWKVYPMQLRLPLPTIPIPLRETDSDVGLQLQPLIDKIYEEGGHDDIDYRNEPPPPPLSKADAQWAVDLVAEHRKYPAD
jgi:hypothetical protein